MQGVRGMPSLHVDRNNRFVVLDVEEIDSNILSQDMPTKALTLELPRKPWMEQWEQRLPRDYMIASSQDSSSLQLSIQIQTTDTGELFGLEALLDSGASGLFIDSEFVKAKQINTHQLTRPIPVNNVDGSPNERGPI